MPRGHAGPALGLELPAPSVIIGNMQDAEMAWVGRVGLHQVNAPRHFGQPGIERVAVAMPTLGPAAAGAPGQCRQQYDDYYDDRPGSRPAAARAPDHTAIL